MSWVTILWSMNAAVFLTLAGIHLFIWLKARSERGHLLFAFSAVGAAGFAACELLMMRAETVERYGAVMRWAHVPLWMVAVSIVWFTRLHLRAGRLWLAWTLTVMRTLVLAINFLTTTNFNFKVITGLRRLRILGESISVADGTPNPWVIVGRLSGLLLLAFMIDAAITVWRRGERDRALFLGGTMIFFTIIGTVHSALVEKGAIQSPYLISFAYLGIILAMGYELSRDVLRATQLVHELQESESGLRESEARFRTMANSAPVLIWMSDTNKLRTFFNKNWLDFTGRTLEQELGDGWTEGVHSEDLNRLLEVYANSFEMRQGFTMEYRLRKHDGQYGWVLAVGAPRFAPDGLFLGYIGSCVDISGRKQAELEIQSQRMELAHLSRVTMLGELSGSLAHELNQPLTAILSNAQAAQRFLAHDDANLDELREILGDIVSQDKRAGEVIHRLRLLLKKNEVEHNPVDLNDAGREVLKLVRNDLLNQQVTAQLELARDLPTIVGDRVQLQQVLLNLVMNGCDAIASAPVSNRTLTIRTRLIEGDGILVSVTDEGVGLAPDQTEKVFDPFFTTKPNGMGLGLSVCRTIITAHRGRLWAENNTERGATFYFTIPALLEPQL